MVEVFPVRGGRGSDHRSMGRRIVLLDVFTAPDVRAWRRMSQLRGYAMRASALERVARRAQMLSGCRMS